MTSTAALTATTVITVLAVGLVAVERGRPDARRLAIVAALAAAAAASRILFVALPNVKPVTVIVLVTGATLGPRAGFAVGALTPLLSNMALGQGTWTPAQMALWGLAGVTGAALGFVCRNPRGLAAVGFVWGFLFGWAMNLWTLAVLGPVLNWASFVATSGRSLSFDTAHAVGNVVFALTIGGALTRLLLRYRNRLTVTIIWADPTPDPVPALTENSS